VSGHAANTFALAVFLGNILKTKFKYFLVFMLFWAALVSYSRIYLGVHYPADLIGGAILGSSIGYLGFFLCKKLAQRLGMKSLGSIYNQKSFQFPSRKSINQNSYPDSYRDVNP
nr:phosphatase PAP2 family protein [Bacteroidota bacterium]